MTLIDDSPLPVSWQEYTGTNHGFVDKRVGKLPGNPANQIPSFVAFSMQNSVNCNYDFQVDISQK
jgi:hypothetical protein